MSDQKQQAESSAEAERVQRGVGLFRIGGRSLVEVTGDDRVRWLDGMLTNEVTSLSPGSSDSPGPAISGCYAALLTHQGRIVADMHVLARQDAFWLDISDIALSATLERLEHHIIADDVQLAEISAEWAWLGIEGPRASDLVAALVGRDLGLEAESWAEVELAECGVTVARWGCAVTPGYRLLVPVGRLDAVYGLVRAVGEAFELIEASAGSLEILRIEAGRPRFGAELDESVLPAEARLDRAISQTKGCYIGQEVVARMVTAGRSSHLLVGLRFAASPADVGSEIRADGKKIGEVTSACVSAVTGAIALGFVRSAHATPGNTVQVGVQSAVVSALPFESS